MPKKKPRPTPANPPAPAAAPIAPSVPSAASPPPARPVTSFVPPEPDGELGFRAIVDIVWSGKWIVASVLAIALAVGGVRTTLAVPIYQADALMQLEGRVGGMGLHDMMGAYSGDTRADAEIQILQSRLVLGQVVDRLDFDRIVVPDYFPVIGEHLARRYSGASPAPPRLGSPGHAWGGETLRVDRFDVSETSPHRHVVLVAGEGESYEVRTPRGERLFSGRVGEASGLPAEESGGDPALEIFVSELIARPGTRFHVRRQDRLGAIHRLQRNLSVRPEPGGILRITYRGADRAELVRVLDGLMHVYMRQHLDRRSAEAQQSLDFLDNYFPELRAQLEAAEQVYNDFRREHGAVDVSAEMSRTVNRLTAVEAELAQLDVEEAEIARRFTEQHPNRIALQDKRQRLQRERHQLQRRVESLPEREQEAMRLRREVDVADQLYVGLLNRAQELRMVQAGTIGNVRILDHAVVGPVPVSPNHSQARTQSLMLGLLLGVGLVFTGHFLQRTVRDPEALEQALGMPIFSVVPHSRVEAAAARRALRRRRRRGEHATPILAKTHPQDPAVEGLRSLRTSLHFALTKPQSNVIALTSPHPSSGKSFVSINAGFVYAETGKRVLVIDADLRRGCLHEYLGRGRGPGLSELLAGRAKLENVIERIEGTTLDVMPTGALPPNPSELLMGEGIPRLLCEAREAYDLIVFDTPPALAVTDAAVIGANVGAMFLLVRAGRSHLSEIEAAVKRLQTSGICVTGLLFNDLGARRQTYGKPYAYYQYEYTASEGR
jgi:tyrosine-protein kinase Etk/Wzc